ncbi:patatin-like phospholipase family protein [bacterium]|nr:patatin-like phospholipase family protein [bacterium]
MKDFDSFGYTCLFGGGAIRGAAHVGVIKALEEFGIVPRVYGGSSVGSIIAALYAVGYSYDELAEIFLSVNFELFRDLSLGFSQKFALSKGEVFLNWLRELIEKKFYKDQNSNNKPVRFKDIDKNLIIITTDMKDFSCREFSTFATPDFEIAMAVRISCCMPGLMRAVSLDDRLLVDGDLMKGKPMWSLSENLKNSNNRILEIRLEGTFSGSDKNPIEYVNGMYSCMTSSETDFVRSIYQDNDMYDYLVVNTGEVVVVDFNYPVDKRQWIINEGYKQTVEYFTKVLPAKKYRLREVYLRILDKLRKVQEAMLRKRYNLAKSVIGELFICLSDCRSIIDPDVYSEISNFQKVLFDNVTCGLLGYTNCKNKNYVFNLLKSSISGISDRIIEFDHYLAKFPV